MIFKETELKDAHIIELEEHRDQRGFFARSFCQDEFNKRRIGFQIVQANISFNKLKHTLRGMHYQASPHREIKLVRCIKGKIYDVIIDLRPGSPSFKKWLGVELNQQNRRMLYVPEGFAHGFLTLEDETEVTYLVSEYYTPGAEKGIKYDDPAFNISWPAKVEIISEKDSSWPPFRETYAKSEPG